MTSNKRPAASILNVLKDVFAQRPVVAKRKPAKTNVWALALRTGKIKAAALAG